MNMLRGLAEIELDMDQWTGRRLIFSRSEVNFLLLKSEKRSWQMKKISLSHQILFEHFHVTIVCFQRCFFFLPLSDTHTHRNAPDGCNWCAGTAAANNCNYQKWLVSWKQSRMSFYVWVLGSDAGGTLGNSTLQLIFNILKLIVFSHAVAPAELFTRWCEMNFWVFLLPQSW